MLGKGFGLIGSFYVFLPVRHWSRFLLKGVSSVVEVISNGSKWAGQAPDSIEKLCEVLERHPLNFFAHAVTHLIPDGAGEARFWSTEFFGNFQTVSHVFHIRTDDPKLVDRLTALFMANPAYIARDFMG